MEIAVELDSAVGPRVVVHGDWEAEDVLDALPAGWTIHDEDWHNGVKTDTGGMSFPLAQQEVAGK